jgi:hemerythrin-like metal-binding protein
LNSIDIFPWNENFNTGIPQIDEQHKKLVQLLNRLASYVAFHDGLPDLEQIFDELADYAIYHFQEEERIWHQYLPDEAVELEHKRIHQVFVETIAVTKAKIRTTSENIIIEELLSFLTRWLATHILENDRFLAAIVINLQSGAAMEDAKTQARERLGGDTKILIDLILSIYDSLSVNTLSLMRELKYRTEQEEKIKQYAQTLEASFMKMVRLATTLSEMRDPYTAGHEERVAKISVAIGKEMGLDEHRLEGLKVGGHLHDLGKMSIPVEILSKPTHLTPFEFELIKQHPQAGYDVLKDVGFPWPVDIIALQHHERIDGSGYPNGLKGDEISLEARIIAVADVVESMSSHRPYRPSLGLERALAEIERGRGTIYDAVVVDSCLRLFREKGYE